MKEACFIATRAHYTEEGTGNRDRGSWNGMEPHEVSLGQV